MKNQGYLSQKITGVVIKDYADNLAAKDESPLSSLTSREMEVLQLIAEGRSTAEIADRLFVSVKTISTHRGRLMEKLAVGNVAGLTRIAIREGVVSIED
jgi:DNA-binding CsgD family transcriptional regulator